MRNQRGSAYIYVLLMVLSITIISLAIADSSLSFSLSQTRAEQRSQAEYLLDGAGQHLEVARVYSRIPVPSSGAITIDGNNITLDYRATLDPKQMQVTAKGTVANREYRKVSYTGYSRPTPFYYGIASKAAMVNPAKKLILGKLARGSLYAYTSFTSNGNLGEIYGDIESFGAISTDMVVSGTKYPNVAADIFTTTGLLDYFTLSSTKFAFFQDWSSGYTFTPAASASAPYHLVHITGGLNIAGTITGKGTIYVAGDVRVKAPITYANADSKLVIIASGRIDVDNDAVGYYYAMGAANIKKKLTGGFYAVGALTWDGGVEVDFDPYIAVNPEEGTRFRLPGY